MGTLYFDFETLGLAYDAPKLGLAWAYDDEEPQWLPMTGVKDEFVRAVQTLLLPGYKIVAHNAAFDLSHLDNLGVVYKDSLIRDSMLLSYLLWPLRPGGHSLGNLGKLYNAPKGEWDHEAMSTLYEEGKISPEDTLELARNPELIEYAKQDIRTMRTVYLDLCRQADEVDKTNKEFKKLYFTELKYLLFLKQCRHNGYILDMVRLPSAELEAKQLLEQVKDSLTNQYPIVPGVGTEFHYKQCQVPLGVGDVLIGCKREVVYDPITQEPIRTRVPGKRPGTTRWGPPEYKYTYEHCDLEYSNFNSYEHKLELLQRVGWVPSNPQKPSTSADELEPYAEEDSPRGRLCAEILKYQELSKLYGTYLKNFREKAENGILRGNFNQCVAKTGRLSSSNPNLQNLTRRGDAGNLVRSLFIARPGYLFASCDLDQIEYRVLADAIAREVKDDTLLLPFLNNEDVHTFNSIKWGLVERFGKAARDEAKITAYAVIFGGGAMVAGRGDYVKGAWLLKQFYKENPAFSQWRDKKIKEARQNRGVFYSRFGRRFEVPGLDSGYEDMRARAERICISCNIQGTAADIFKILTVDARPIWDELGALYMGPVHDEVTFNLLEDFAEGDAACIEETLSSPAGGLLLCDVKSKCKVGPSWKECH